MAGAQAAGQSAGVSAGGQTFQRAAEGPTVDRFDKLGGPYRAAWDRVADQLQTTDRTRIVDELGRQVGEEGGTPAEAASAIQAAATRPVSRGPGTAAHTDEMAAHVAALARTDPGRARAVESELLGRLPAGDASRLSEDLRAVADRSERADARLAGNAPAPGGRVEAGKVKATGDALLRGATVALGGRAASDRTRVDTAELAYSVQKLGETDPSLARAVRADLSTRLSPVDAADLDRIVAGDTRFGETIGTALSHPVDGGIGAAKGFANGFLALGDLFTRGSTLNGAAEVENAAGIQGLLGNNREAERGQKLGSDLRDAASRPMIEQIPYANAAQSGGGDIGTIADVALAGKGLVTGGAKLAARGAGEAAEIAGAGARRVEAASAAKAAAPVVVELDEAAKAAKSIKIDLPHILQGHLNAKGKAVGFHSRPGAIDPPEARIVTVTKAPDQAGVYKARIEVRDSGTGNWVPKKVESTFYPDRMTHADVETAVRDAYADAVRHGGVGADGRFTGDSGAGFEVTGIVRNGDIVTAYPIDK